jgi:Spy/CpxP family protein refolding chaperone
MPLFAQKAHSPYSGEQHREINALSPAEIGGYLKGEGMGLARAAELNHYPGPRHVIELASELKLTEEQRLKIEKIYNAMRERAIQLGKWIVQKERELDQLFKTESINKKSLEKLVREMAVLQGELRLVHLQAHMV